MTQVTIKLSPFHFRNVNGEAVKFDPSTLPADFLPEALNKALFVVLTNNWTSAGDKTVADPIKLAAVNKRWDAWTKGSWTIVDRGDSQTTAMREAYVVEQLTAMGIDPKDRAATKEAEKAIALRIKQTVEKVLGKDTVATFTAYLAAIATGMSKVEGNGTKDEILEALESKYEGLAAEAAKRLADSVKAVVIPDAMTMDLSAFMKPKAA